MLMPKVMTNLHSLEVGHSPAKSFPLSHLQPINTRVVLTSLSTGVGPSQLIITKPFSSQLP